MFETYVHQFLCKHIDLDIDKEQIKINNGIYIYGNKCFSPDALYVDNKNNIIHIFEYKSPAK